MRNLRLITLLETFTKEEMKSFWKFISSPYFNSQRNFKPLYTILKKHHPHFSSKQLSEENLFRKLYPEIKFDKKKSSLTLRVLFSQMTNLAKKFLAYEKYESGDLEYEYNCGMAEALENKKLYDLSFRTVLKNSNLLDANEKAPEFYDRRITTNKMLSSLLLDLGNQKDAFEYERNNILYFYAYMFNNLATFLNNAFVTKYSFNISFKGFEMAKSFVESFDPELFDKQCAEDRFETKNITLYNYHIIRSRFDENDKESLLKTLEFYYKFFGNVSQVIQWLYFTKLFNRFIGRQRLDRIYSVKASELVDFVWGKGILNEREDGRLGINSYGQALKIKAYLFGANEVRKFIDTYSDKVKPGYLKEVRNYSMAYLHFKEGLYEKCLECVSRKDTPGASFTLDKYKFKMCSLYELEYYEEALYAADAFEHYMRGHKDIGPIIRENSMEFIRGFRNLMQLEFGNKDIIPEKIRETNKYTIFGDWFNEKVDKLLKVQPVAV